MDPSLIMYIIVSFLLLFLISDGHVVFENGSQKEQLIFHLPYIDRVFGKEQLLEEKKNIIIFFKSIKCAINVL